MSLEPGNAWDRAQCSVYGETAHYILCSYDVEIDAICRTLRRDSEIVKAPRKVMDLIFHLSEHRGRVLSKREIGLAVWPKVRVAETSLRWLLKEVRRYLGDSGESPKYVETVRGYGLRWAAPVSLIPCPGAQTRAIAGSRSERAPMIVLPSKRLIC